MSHKLLLSAALAVGMAPAAVEAQINFSKTDYYVAMGDSVAAGEGAMPVTAGYTYRLYDEGVFAAKQQMDFSSVAIRGARTWEFRDHQVPLVLCSRTALRPNVITITVGANDFLGGDQNVLGIATRVVEGINLLLNNTALGVVRDPSNVAVVCPSLSNVTILVSNYYSIPHPDPTLNALLNQVLAGFDQALRALLPLVNVPAGSRVELVDLYNPSLGRESLVLIGRRFGLSPTSFEVHPTNAGHAFIAAEFAATWKNLQ